MSKGAGAWGEVNPAYRRYAMQMRFHPDPCPVRAPRAKGKVERKVRDQRCAYAPGSAQFEDLEALQRWTDAQIDARSARLRCPATGTSVAEAWAQERALLTPLPETLPEPFDLVRDCRVGDDGLVHFEGRQYSVLFRFVRQVVEVRGLARHVQCLKDCEEIARHPRNTAARLLVNDSHYEGTSTAQVIAPPPLGRMGRRLQELTAIPPAARRSLDLYAALAEARGR